MESQQRKGMVPTKADKHVDIAAQCDHHLHSLCLLNAKKAKNNHTYKENTIFGLSTRISPRVL